MSSANLVFAAANGVNRNPWNVGTATYRGIVPFSSNIASVDINPRGMYISTNGSFLFVVGGSNDRVYRYTLNTPWQISTATYLSDSFSVSAQTGLPTDLFFRPNGTRMFVSSPSTIFQYDLSLAYDLDFAIYNSVSFSVSSQETAVTGLFIRSGFLSAGTDMYVIGTANNTVYEYSLGTPYDLSTASYSSRSFSVASQTTLPQALSFRLDGEKMYVLDLLGRIFQYSLSSPWNVSTASYDNVTYNGQVFSYGIFIRGTSSTLSTTSDGVTIYTVAGVTPVVATQYQLSSAWNLATAQNTGSYFFFMNVVSTGTQRAFAFKDDGTKMYFLTNVASTVYQFSLSTPWDITTATYDSLSVNVSAQGVGYSIKFKPDGTKMFVLQDGTVYQYSLSTAWNVSTATYDSVSYVLSAGVPFSIAFKSDGTKLYALFVDAGIRSIYQYSVASAWDISSVTFDSVSLSVSSQGTDPTTFNFKSDGGAVYVGNGSSVFQYGLTSNWDLSTASYSSISKSLAGQNLPSITDIGFKPDGNRMFVVNNLYPAMLQYEMG